MTHYLSRIFILSFWVVCSQTLFALGKTRIGELYYILDEYARTAEVTASIDQQGMAGNYPDLESIVIPDTVSYLGKKYAVQTIGDYAFANTENLTTVVIPDHIQSIGSDAFNHCRNLTSVTLPEGIDTLCRTFGYCTSLRQITIPESVVSMNALFSGCTNLDSVVLPPNITLLAYTFANCINLQHVNLPDSLQIIRRLTFQNCTRLHTITIPEKVTEINMQAFKDCPAMDTIRVLAVEPPIARSESFSGMNKPACVLLVPAQSVDLYREAPCWKNFNVQPQKSPTAIPNTSYEPSNTIKVLHDGHIYILRGNKKTYTLTGQELK